MTRHLRAVYISYYVLTKIQPKTGSNSLMPLFEENEFEVRKSQEMEMMKVKPDDRFFQFFDNPRGHMYLPTNGEYWNNWSKQLPSIFWGVFRSGVSSVTFCMSGLRSLLFISISRTVLWSKIEWWKVNGIRSPVQGWFSKHNLVPRDAFWGSGCAGREQWKSKSSSPYRMITIAAVRLL